MLGAPFLNAQDRFPRPEFDSKYQIPKTTTPAPRSEALEILDVLVLAIALGLASYFSIKRRSRKALFRLSIFSLIYFGFYREGCICSVGSIQNIALALADPLYLMPLTAIIFFALPLIVALFYGRAFCAGVCPLGAAQELMLQKPAQLPHWLNQTLSIIPYIYLGFAILFAATGSAFIICRYDPFVGFFRFGAGFEMLILGGVFLFASIFISRPYCRFFCPYGALLSILARFTRKQATVTPDTCIQCRLCEEACPNGALRIPVPAKTPETRKKGVRRLAVLIVLIPVIMAAGGWAVSSLNHVTAQVHPDVQLAEQIVLEDAEPTTETTLASRTFRASGTPTEELIQNAMSIRNQFHTGGWLLGAFLGLVFGLKLIGLSVQRRREDYEPDPADCINCGRCFNSCPKDPQNLADATAFIEPTEHTEDTEEKTKTIKDKKEIHQPSGSDE